MHDTPFTVHESNDFAYIDKGPTASPLPPIVLLHGLLGDLDNWTDTVYALAEAGYRVVVPVIPVYELSVRNTHIPGLTDYIRDFVEFMEFDQTVLVGNSLGGHIALLYALDYPETVHAMVLSGSSGIYEASLGNSTMRRRDREFIRERTEMTFYDPKHATDELIDKMLNVLDDRGRAIRLIKIARSADKEIVTDRLGELNMPTLLVWGANDEITPPDVGREFQERMPQATLHFIDKCGHAPMIEHPKQFNAYVLDFLEELTHNELSAWPAAS
ncbi:alpha/beta fold hydrolase [Salisaeta longa]|uniref:alpha/beta fold hydrolase n=1 Tax=Salisaeta longa TaxID=503170 RepID=UPI00058CD279|nr:alpha/beta hydrolase [Salisaeta longa]